MMDYKGMNIIERIPAYSNLMMLERCKTLYSVVTATKEVTIRRGKQPVIESVPKFHTEKDVIEEIKNSITYYQKLHNHEMNNQIELRDYQEKIVSREIGRAHV